MKMEPNNNEKQFRDKLNKREIQPSVQAWDRLDAMLSLAEESKKKPPFGFLFIAAGILVFLTLGIFFFTQNGTEIKPINNVTRATIKNDSVLSQGHEIQNLIPQEQLNGDVVNKENPKGSKATQKSNHQQFTNNQGVAINNQKTNNPREQRTSEQSNRDIIIKNKPVVYQNSSDVALKDIPKTIDPKESYIQKTNSQQDFIKKGSYFVTDDLLMVSLDDVARQSTIKKSSVKVDARNLLSQLDGELDLTFREKVISKVNKNYREVKVALANRNKD
jgi:hypothetical protein